jgi:hypothetical protein
MCFSATLRSTTSQGFVSARGNTVKERECLLFCVFLFCVQVRALEPLCGRVELREVYELVTGSSAELFALLGSCSGFNALVDAAVFMDVDVDWGLPLQNAFLDGNVEVAESFSPALSVANVAVNVLFIYPLKVLGLASMFPPEGSVLVRVGFKQQLAGPLLSLSYHCTCLGGEAPSKGSFFVVYLCLFVFLFLLCFRIWLDCCVSCPRPLCRVSG